MTELKIKFDDEQINEIADKVAQRISDNKPVAKKNEKRLLTKTELSEKLHISMPTIDRWSRKGILKRIEIEGRVLFSEDEVEKLLNK